MPVIKIQHVSSVSSEDPNHPADNLLNLETYRKWKCATAGEKKAVVILQLDKSTQIHSVDIGNEGSAFVEVLLGRSSSPDSFEVLLGMSTFMTPAESKQWTNTNRVRMFGNEKFAKNIYDQKWDRVKFVCTQPYNKSEKYGLSFINLHSPPSTDSSVPDPSPSKLPTKLGAFSLKEETKDLPSGTFFFKKDHPTTSSSASMSVAAQARVATTEALKTVQSDSPSTKTNQSDSPTRKANQSPSSRSKTAPVKETKNKKRPAESTTPSSSSKKAKVADVGEPLSGTMTVPRNRIMSGVVFSLSGFKNPFRGELREKAIDMGAKFQPDWTSTCTHLVCAFPGTPKFDQVKAKHGLIVSKEWILDSHVKKRRLPARKYRLSSGDSGSSEDDFYDKKEEAMFDKKMGGANSEKKPLSKVGVVKQDVGVVEPKDANDIYGGSTDEESDSEVKSKPHPPETNDSSECDTEDEIERVREKELQKAQPTEDPYGESTDDEDNEPTISGSSETTKKPSLSNLPNFFSKFTFLLYGTFSPADRRLITRYITAYNGLIDDYMSDRISHVITVEKWDDNFDQALTENSHLAFVGPKWIFACHQKQTCVPCQPFVVTPA